MKLSELFKICDDWHGYQTVGHDVNYKFLEEGDRLLIFYQGSSSLWDWIRNFMYHPQPYRDMSIPFKVHGGFLAAWKEVEDIILEKIKDPKWKDITVVGYSHGGALCQFTVEAIWYHRPDLREGGMRGYAFESPRIFAQWKMPKELEERWENLFVTFDGTDIVPHCPPLFLKYRDLGSKIKIKGDTSLVKEWYIPKCVKYHYPQVVYDALVKFENGEE